MISVRLADATMTEQKYGTYCGEAAPHSEVFLKLKKQASQIDSQRGIERPAPGQI